MVEEIKTRLREEIRRSGLTTVELARRVGVTPEMITQYCTTKKLPRLDTFAKLCQELDVSADYILGLPEEKTALAAVFSFIGFPDEYIRRWSSSGK